MCNVCFASSKLRLSLRNQEYQSEDVLNVRETILLLGLPEKQKINSLEEFETFDTK